MPDRAGAAEYLLNNDLLKEIFTDIEADALERAVNAKPSDDEARRAATQEVRAIRAVQRQLEVLLRAKTKPKPRPVV